MATFSVTERGTFKRCEREWRLTSRHGMHLGPIVSPVYLSVGTLIHEGSQHWMLNDPAGYSYEDHVTVASDKLITKAHARYLKQVGAEISPEEDEVLYEAVHFARTMAKNYEARWGGPLPEGFTLIRPEQRAQVPVPGTEHSCEFCTPGDMPYIPNADCVYCGGTGKVLHYLDMRFDGIVADKVGRFHILEHKTYNARPSLASLKFNDQFLAYMWGARQLKIGQVVGLAYDGLWRRDAVPRGKTFEDLFLRFEHTRSEAEFEEFGRLLPYELNEMWSKRPDLRPLETLPFNRRWLGCFDCRFDDDKDGNPGLCSAISRNETALQKVLLASKYTERDDDVEDPSDESATGGST